MSVRVRFYLSCEAVTDKTSTHLIKSVQIMEEDVIYMFPPAYQSVSQHTELCTLGPIKSALKCLKARNQFRNIKVTLPDDIHKLYFDSEGNACFKGEYLPEIGDTQKLPPPPTVSSDPKKCSLQSLTKDMVCTKFNGHNANAQTWLKLFVMECDRLGVLELERVPALRLFLDGIASEWFTATWTLQPSSTWDEWSQVFLDNFGEKGWSEVISAFNFRYIGGSYTDYAIKKLNLLLQADPDLTEKSRVMFIVIGLPQQIRDKINRKTVDTQRKLMLELSRFESSPSSKSTQDCSQWKDSFGSSNSLRKRFPPKHCSICLKAGRRKTLHSEDNCWFNEKSANYRKPENRSNNNSRGIKIANNTELEHQLNKDNEVPKN